MRVVVDGGFDADPMGLEGELDVEALLRPGPNAMGRCFAKATVQVHPAAIAYSLKAQYEHTQRPSTEVVTALITTVAVG